MLSLLVAESQREGFRFIRRLLHDYEEGTNRFDQLGECLVGAFASDGQLIAIAGLNTDPYCDATRSIGCAVFTCLGRIGVKAQAH